MGDTPTHSVSVAGIVVDEAGKVLIIQRRDNAEWQPPGGVLELDETPQVGVIREVFEETGIRVDIDALTGVYKNLKLGVVALVFRCRPSSSQTQAAETLEAQEVRWEDPSAAARLMDPVYAVRVMDAVSDFDAPTVHVRSHDGVVMVD